MKVFYPTIDNEYKPDPRSGEGRFTSVMLFPFRGDIREFRCINCGRIVFKYEGEVVNIVDSGELPEMCGDIEALCKFCKMVYRVFW